MEAGLWTSMGEWWRVLQQGPQHLVGSLNYVALQGIHQTKGLSPLNRGEWPMSFISRRRKLNTCEQLLETCWLDTFRPAGVKSINHPEPSFWKIAVFLLFRHNERRILQPSPSCNINLKHLIELLTYIWKSGEHIFCGKALQSDWFVSL